MFGWIAASLVLASAQSTTPFGGTPGRDAETGPTLGYAERGYCRFGAVVGKAGDFDRDGVPDLIVGDVGSAEEKEPPRLWVLSGKDGRVLRAFLLPERIRLGEIDGGTDFDGDGVPDLLLLGDPYGGTTTLGSRSVDVVSGKTGEFIRSFDGGSVPSNRISWAGVLADRDGDGVPEIGLLCPATGPARGTLFVHSGKSGRRIAEVRIENPACASFGSVAEVDDMDGDGRRELAVLFVVSELGEVATQGSGPWPGSKDLRTSSLTLYSSSHGEKLWSRSLSDRDLAPNARLTRIQDTDQDGRSDLLVGFSETVEVVGTRSGSPLLRFTKGSDEEQGFGCGLAALEDLDGDGIPDFALSEYDTGPYDGMVAAKSGKDGHELWRATSCSVDEVHHLGSQIAKIGDIDGDGTSDLVIGSEEGPDTFAHGEAEVRSGKSGRLLFQFRRSLDDVIVTRRGPWPEGADAVGWVVGLLAGGGTSRRSGPDAGRQELMSDEFELDFRAVESLLLSRLGMRKPSSTPIDVELRRYFADDGPVNRVAGAMRTMICERFGESVYDGSVALPASTLALYNRAAAESNAKGVHRIPLWSAEILDALGVTLVAAPKPR